MHRTAHLFFGVFVGNRFFNHSNAKHFLKQLQRQFCTCLMAHWGTQEFLCLRSLYMFESFSSSLIKESASQGSDATLKFLPPMPFEGCVTSWVQQATTFPIGVQSLFRRRSTVF